ncbi:MAG: hypothetical protein V3W08_05015, partial [Candidatus Binatia bacterium]
RGTPPEARLAPWSTHHGRDESLRVRTYSTRQAKEGASADCAEEMKDTTGVSPWRLHFCFSGNAPISPYGAYGGMTRISPLRRLMPFFQSPTEGLVGAKVSDRG